MITTIDKAGRVVIPSGLRKRAHLKPGSAIRVELEDGVIRISRDVEPAELVKHRGRMLAKPKGRQQESIDLSALVEEERNRWPL
ncbi:MAG: AbrB/MazE/SpoVT family DNA-binding domain-containing protein [Oceanipulchritudo sp.]